MSDERVPLSEAAAERLARYRAGALSREEREAFERDALADDALAMALYEDEALDARTRRRVRTYWRELALAAGFVAALGGALWWGVNRESPSPPLVRRGGTVAVRLLEPSGALDAAPARFAWTRDAGAESYRFELRDEDGRLLTVRIVRDTVLSAADVGVSVPSSGSWGVVPIAPDGGERPAPSRARFGPVSR